MEPRPPVGLTTEELNVWNGWKNLRDREVVRESAAKGVHVSLAHKFISARQQWELPETQKWFEAQVRYWALELLNMRQVFKATHILTNIKLDAYDEFIATLLDTKDKDLADFLASHLIKIKKLSSETQNCWHLAQLVQKHSSLINTELSEHQNYEDFTVKRFMDFTQEWKTKLATILFFTQYDNSIVTFLNPKESWHYLLKHDELFLIHDWLYISFNPENFNKDKCLFQPSDTNSLLTLHELFSKWTITEEMFNIVQTETLLPITKDYVTCQFSNYGVFNRNNLSLSNIVVPLAKMEKLPSLNEILNLKTSNVTLEEFSNLLVEYCLKHNLYEVIVSYFTDSEQLKSNYFERFNSKQLNLWTSLCKMYENSNDFQLVSDCIKKGCDISDNFKLEENPVIFLALILFSNEIDLKTFLTDEKATFLDLNREILLKTFPFFNSILNENKRKQDITLYQLLTNYMNIDYSQVLYFRYKSNEPIPNFSSERLIQRYGHREKLTFTFYLKSGRPSIASKLFIIENFKKYKRLTNKSRHIGANLAHAIAMQSFDDLEVSSACVAFIEMIGVRSEITRLHITIANILKRTHSLDHIVNLFANFIENQVVIANSLEKELMETNEGKFTNILMHWDVAVQFAKMYNLPYPESYLKYCLKNNLWLEFLFFAQYHCYPFEKILSMSQYFANSAISEHISHAIAFDWSSSENNFENEKSRREMRRTPGVKFDIKPTTSTADSTVISSSVSSSSADHVDTELPIDYYVENVDFFQILCRVHRSNDRMQILIDTAKKYENPMFLVFATCYEPEKLVLCWLIWICVATGLQNLTPSTNMDLITPSIVENILKKSVKKKFIGTLNESFLIFLPENPLCSLTAFLYEFVKKSNEDALKSLRLFKTIIKFMKFNSETRQISIENSPNLSFLTNVGWLSEMSLNLTIDTLIYKLSSNYEQQQLVQLLIDENFLEHLTISSIPDLEYYKALLDLTFGLKINLEKVIRPENQADRENELHGCINQLISEKQFDVALKLCELEKLPVDSVIIEKWKHDFVEYQQQTNPDIKQFWNECDKSLRNFKVNPLLVSNFYKNCACLVADTIEKYILLKLAYNWLKDCKVDDIDIQNIELEMWTVYLTIDDYDDEEFVEEPCLKFVSLEIRRRARLLTLSVHGSVTNDDRLKENFEKLINRLLDTGNIVQAIRLEHIFNYKTANLALIETCIKLAEGELAPDQLQVEHRLLLEKINMNRKRKRTLSSMCHSSSYGDVSNVSPAKEMIELNSPTICTNVLIILEGLLQQITHGTCLAGRVLCCSRIAEATSRPYARILANCDAVELLKITLTGDFDNKLELANDIMTYHNWSKHQICEFLCSELVAAISKHVLKESSLVEPICLWGYPLESTMHLVLQLCPDTSILGGSLLVHAKSPLTSPPTQRNVLSLAAELLIRAHDCFTADCNVEGISKVLNQTRILVPHLAALEAWPTIVRILTGLNRYNEMDYVFQTLLDKEQFEWLLGQGTARAVGLQRATISFLRRNCPGRRELTRLVALRWGMHDCAAELWENEAQDIINNLVDVAKLDMQNVGRALQNSPKELLELNGKDPVTSKILENAMTCYTHAVQHQLLANRYNAAERSTCAAELVALQLGLITRLQDRIYCILQINEEQFNYLMAQELEFYEAHILSRCYPKYPTDWSQILYQQCVVHNNYKTYLPPALQHIPVTDVIVKNVVRKFLTDSKFSKIHNIPNSVRALLDAVKSVLVKYRLASELGLKDVVQDLLEGPSKAYLKDTVWKSGCPTPNL